MAELRARLMELESVTVPGLEAGMARLEEEVEHGIASMAEKEREWTQEMQRLEIESEAREAELQAELEELKTRCGVAEQRLVAKIRQYREQTKRAETAEASLAETRADLQSESAAHTTARGELATAREHIKFLEGELYGTNGKVKRLEGELAAEKASAESLRYSTHARARAHTRAHAWSQGRRVAALGFEPYRSLCWSLSVGAERSYLRRRQR